MKRSLFFLILVYACACTGEEPEFSNEANQKEVKPVVDPDPKTDDPTPSYTPTAEDIAVDRTLFELLDLSYTPLADVKALYNEKKYKAAADSFLSYFKHKRKVVNSNVVLPATLTNKEWDIANQALPENGYRFYIAVDSYCESFTNGHYITVSPTKKAASIGSI